MLNFAILLELLAILKCNPFFIGKLNRTTSTVYIRPTSTVVVTMNASKMPRPSQRTSLPNHKTSVKGIESFFFNSGYFCCVRCCCYTCCCLHCYYCYCCCYCCCCCCYCCCYYCCIHNMKRVSLRSIYQTA